MSDLSGLDTRSRRDVLKWASAISAGAAGGMVIPSGSFQPNAQATSATPGGTLIYARVTEAPHINPLLGGVAGQQVMALVYDTLVRLDQELQIVPDLAESWESPDDLTYIFKLRQGVVWHNGRTFEAADVKILFEWILNPDNGAIRLGDFANLASVEAPDAQTVRFTLSNPNSGFLALLADMFTAILPRELLLDGGDPRNNAIGTGPFKLASWVPDTEMVLVKNDEYHIEGQPLLEELRIQIIPAEDGIVAGLEGETIDQTTLADNKNSLLFQGETNLRVQESPRLGMEFVIINCSIPPLDNELVRQAMSFAIDRREILQGALQGMGRPTGPLPEVMVDWALPVDQFASFTRDVEKAKALLAEAGMPDGFSTTILVIPTFPTFIASAQIIADQMRDVGITIEIEQIDYGIWLDRLVNARDMPLTISVNQGFGDPDAYLYGRFHSKAFNQQNWNEPEVDALLEQGRAASDPAERKAIYDELQRLLADVKVPYLWLYSPDLIDVSQERVQGYVQHPTSLLYGMEQVWLQE